MTHLRKFSEIMSLKIYPTLTGRNPIILSRGGKLRQRALWGVTLACWSLPEDRQPSNFATR